MFLREFIQERKTRAPSTRENERRRTETRRADQFHLKDFNCLFSGQQLSGGNLQLEENLTRLLGKKKDKAGQLNCWIFTTMSKVSDQRCSRMVFPPECSQRPLDRVLVSTMDAACRRGGRRHVTALGAPQVETRDVMLAGGC